FIKGSSVEKEEMSKSPAKKKNSLVRSRDNGRVFINLISSEKKSPSKINNSPASGQSATQFNEAVLPAYFRNKWRDPRVQLWIKQHYTMIWPTENPEVSQILPDIQRSFQDSEQITSFTLGVPILGRTLATPLQWSSIHFFRHRIIVPIPGNKIVPQLHRLFWCTLPLELVQALWTRQEDTW